MYPRALLLQELEILLWLLPESIPAYKPYADFILRSQVIGVGRWGEGNLLLADKSSSIDLTLGMPPVVAYGESMFDDALLSVSVHEINIDDQLEVQFSGIFPLPESSRIGSEWCYSYWKSGDPCPATGERVKEIQIMNKANKIIYTLVISPSKKVLWLHNAATGFNQLLPITTFYDELLRTKQIRDSALISRPSTLFETADQFTDAEYVTALVEYDKKTKGKFNSSEIVVPQEETKQSFFQKLFSK